MIVHLLFKIICVLLQHSPTSFINILIFNSAQYHALRGVEFFELWIRISPQKRILKQNHFSLIRRPRWVQFMKKIEVENLVTLPLYWFMKPISLMFYNTGTYITDFLPYNFQGFIQALPHTLFLTILTFHLHCSMCNFFIYYITS